MTSEPEESVQSATENAIERLAARQAAKVRAVGAELREQLAAEAGWGGVPPAHPLYEPQVLSLAGQQRSDAGSDVAAVRPRARLRRPEALIAALLLVLLLAGIGGVLSRLVAARHVYPGPTRTAPRGTAAVLVVETPLVAAPVSAPPTQTEWSAPSPAAIAAATLMPTLVIAAATPVPTAVVATTMPTSTAVVASSSAATRSSAFSSATIPAPPIPGVASPAPIAVAQRVVAAEGALRHGQLEAVLDYGNGVRATATLAFDYGDATQPQRFHLTTVYTSPTGSQTTERITVGTRAWDRQPDGRWVVVPEQEGVWGRVQPFLPHVDQAPAPELRNDAGGAHLHWTAATLDITVLIDPASGIPRELRQVNRATGATLVVTYRGWNTPVDIVPPAGA